MSNWIQVTNLPYYYDEKEAMDMFNDIGPIKRVEIERVQLSLKSTALIQFVHNRNSRLAATKKDQIVVGNGVIRVRVVWCRKETLATVKVSNLPPSITDRDLRDYFAPYGDIVDVRFNKNNANETYDDKLEDSSNNEVAACISFARVDYALRACHEMHHSIISGCSDDSGLCVSLVNPDSRNLKWKRNLFEYVRCSVPSKRTKGGNHRSHKNSTNSKTLKSNISFSASTGYSPASVCRPNMNDKMSTRPPLLNMPSMLPNTNTNSAGAAMSWLPSMYDGGVSMNANSGTNSISGANDASKNIGVAPCMNFNNINTFNNMDGNNINVANIIPKLNMTDLLLQSSSSLQSPGMFTQQHSNSVRSETVSSPCMFNNTTGMSPSGFTPLFLPNMFLTIPQNGSFVSPMSTSSMSSGVTPLLPHGFPTPSLINSPSANSVLSLQQTHSQKTVSSTSSTVNSSTDTFANNVLSPKLTQLRAPSCANLNSVVLNPIHTPPNLSTRSTSTPSPMGTKGNHPSDSPSFASVTTFSDSIKEQVTGNESVATPSQKSVSVSGSSISNDIILSPSIWSAKQREMGDTIYHELKSEFPERVAKLTGMLLSLPKEELSPLLLDRYKLKARARQFVQLLNKNKPV